MVQRPASLLRRLLTLAFLQHYVLAIAVHSRKLHMRSNTRISSALSNNIEISRYPNNDNLNEKLAFSIVPASANPSNKFTKQLLDDILPNKLNGTDVKLLDESNGGRISFCLPAPSQNIHSTTLDGSELGKWLSPYGVKSLRLVVCECELPLAPEDKSDTSSSLPSRQDIILETLEAHLPRPELPWKIYHECFGNTPPIQSSMESQFEQPISFQISCRRWASSRAISRKEFSSTSMKHALRMLLLRKYDGDKSSEYDCEFTLLLFDNKLRLEWTALVPPKSKKFSDADYLPKPGCKRVEAWMLMKNLEQTVLGEISERKANNKHNTGTDEVIVLDPLCGKATYLVEAATTWKMGVDNGTSVSFVGVDASVDQLRDARLNVDAVTDIEEIECSSEEMESCVLITKRRSHDQASTISLYKGDSRDLSIFEDGSVSAIATCPPFGRQFFALEKSDGSDDVSTTSNLEESLAVSYRDWLREWTRILDPQNGRIALLVDIDHQKEALDAIASTGVLHVAVLREPFRLGRVKATVIVADAKGSDGAVQDNGTESKLPDPLSRFTWEGNAKEARAEWTRLRAASLEGLEPYSKTQQER